MLFAHAQTVPVSDWGKIKVKTSEAKSCFKFKDDDGGKLVFGTSYFFLKKKSKNLLWHKKMIGWWGLLEGKARGLPDYVWYGKKHLKNINFKNIVPSCSRCGQLRPSPLLRLRQRRQVLRLLHWGRRDHPAAAGERRQRRENYKAPSQRYQSTDSTRIGIYGQCRYEFFSLLPTATELQSQDAWTRAVPPQRIAWTQVFAQFFLSFCFFTHFLKKKIK